MEDQLLTYHTTPEPRGRTVTTTAYVEDSHASNKVTKISHTGFIIYFNRAPIVWFNKQHNAVK